ncbi:MAG TPA: hypothetical protein VN578_19415, partial [Candidatus Binatia bacterium]|nr:hypothetical protein [Candidatus Binatia bacterium]
GATAAQAAEAVRLFGHMGTARSAGDENRIAPQPTIKYPKHSEELMDALSESQCGGGPGLDSPTPTNGEGWGEAERSVENPLLPNRNPSSGL